MTLWHLFMIGQSVVFPTLTPGSEVRLVSPDLLRVHASGRLIDGVLDLQGDLPPGLEVRVLIFPPDAGPEDTAAALSGATALTARISESGDDVRILPPDGGEPVGWREELARQGVELRLSDDPNGAP